MKSAAKRTANRILIGTFAASVAAGLFAVSAGAQFFDERFPINRGGGIFSPFREQAPQRVDNSHAPPPRKYEKNEADNLSTVMIMGDSMADWLGYGLEAAYADTPDIAVSRKFRSNSSLIFNEPGRGPRSRQFDWAAAAKEILAKENASVVVMMIGLGDRVAIREPKPATPPAGQKNQQQQRGKADAKTQAKPDDKQQQAAKQQAAQQQAAQAEAQKGEGPTEPPVAEQNDDDDNTIAAPEPRTAGSYEFRSEKWVEAYNKRLDEVIAALRTKNVPVIWVGLPPVRGPRAMSDMAYLNELYKARAEKAGIYYVDVWDAFVDENGRFAQTGPDFEGQNRRLRSADGVFFSQAGARKLALFVDKEIRRAMTPSGPIAIPLPVEPGGQQGAASGPAPDQSMPRPLAGPVIPLNASGADMATDSAELAGGSAAKQTVNDVIASRVLTKGEAAPVPAGRADDFVWPRRAPLPVDADPVVARTTIPMTPMLAERPGVTKEASAIPEKQKPRVRTASSQQQQQQRDARRERQQPAPFFFFFNAR